MMKTTNYGWNTITDPKVHVAQMGQGGKRGKKEEDHRFLQMHPSWAYQPRLLKMITETTDNKPKTSTLKGKHHFPRPSPFCDVHNALSIPFLGIFGTLMGP